MRPIHFLIFTILIQIRVGNGVKGLQDSPIPEECIQYLPDIEDIRQNLGKPTAVDWTWEPWTTWSTCSVNCGEFGGIVTRQRTCQDGFGGGKKCPKEKHVVQRPCEAKEKCPSTVITDHHVKGSRNYKTLSAGSGDDGDKKIGGNNTISVPAANRTGKGYRGIGLAVGGGAALAAGAVGAAALGVKALAAKAALLGGKLGGGLSVSGGISGGGSGSISGGAGGAGGCKSCQPVNCITC